MGLDPSPPSLVVTHMNESCHSYEWVMSHIWMTHANESGTHMNDSCMSHVTHMNESCHSYEWVMSHIWISLVNESVTNMNDSYEWVMSHIWISASYHTYECVKSHVWMSHVIFRECVREYERDVTHSRVWHGMWVSSWMWAWYDYSSEFVDLSVTWLILECDV